MGNTSTKLPQGTAVPPAECPAVPNATSEPSSCPVPEKYRNQAVYNVYNQRIDSSNGSQTSDPLAVLRGTDIIDPRNNMPLEANQQPCPGQRKPLPTDRMQSNIPKGGTNSTWLYPSPQMFFNGKRRMATNPCCRGCLTQGAVKQDVSGSSSNRLFSEFQVAVPIMLSVWRQQQQSDRCVEPKLQYPSCFRSHALFTAWMQLCEGRARART